jgi:hypothetical protein
MDFSLCPYRYIFGKPNEGAHQYRIFYIAVVDTGMTIGISYLISKYFNYDFKLILFIIFLSGIILHRLFDVKTTIDKIIFV